MPENFPAGQFLRKADKYFGVCKVNYSVVLSINHQYVPIRNPPRYWTTELKRFLHVAVACSYKKFSFVG